MNSSKFYLSGGFGNLLFQYMAIEFLRKKYQKRVLIESRLIERNFFTTKFLKWSVHQNLSELLFDKEEFFKSNLFISIYELLNLYISKILKRRFRKYYYLPTENIDIDNRSSIIMGYFQNLSLYSKQDFSILSIDFLPVLKSP